MATTLKLWFIGSAVSKAKCCGGWKKCNKADTPFELINAWPQRLMSALGLWFTVLQFNTLWTGKPLRIMSNFQNLFHAWSLRELSGPVRVANSDYLGLWKPAFVRTWIHTLSPSVLHKYNQNIAVCLACKKNIDKGIRLWAQKKQQVCQNLTQFKHHRKLLGFKLWRGSMFIIFFIIFEKMLNDHLFSTMIITQNVQIWTK